MKIDEKQLILQALEFYKESYRPTNSDDAARLTEISPMIKSIIAKLNNIQTV